MSQVHLVRIFLSSPGDVTEERQIALEVIERLPNRPAFREKVAFRIIAWDKPDTGTPMRATLTPQEAINNGLPQPSECDIVVVIFWSRMGTPFSIDGKEFQSGTHWELLDALHADRPQTVIYRRAEKKLFEANDTEGQEQVRRVEAFFKSDLFYNQATGAIRRGVNSYKSPDDFRQQFETHFEELVVERLQRPGTEPLSEPVLVNSPNITIVTTTPWLGSPFPGLRAFTPADAPIYFGRGEETDALVQRVGANRLVALVGASGSGKSSQVGAGLIPRLKANAISGSQNWLLPDWNPEMRQWVGLRFTPGEVGDNPFMALALKLAPLTDSTPRALAEKLAKNPEVLNEACSQLLWNRPEWAEVLIFIDQFEELFTLVHPQFVAPFVDLLELATNSPRIRVIITLRADFYARCVEVPKLADILEATTYPLAAPTSVDLYEMITRPAEQAGLEFEEGLPERILDDTGVAPGALALMAYALDELYHSGKSDKYLTHAEYDALGGVQGAIGRRAEIIFSGLDSEAQNALPTVFREIVEVDERGEPTRRRAELQVVASDAPAKRLVEALTGERARLLVQDKDMQGRPMVEVAHEALLRQWPRLKAWIEREQDNLRLRRQIQQVAQEWAERGRNPAYRLSGGRLSDAQAWIARFPAGELEREFIETSAQLEQEQHARELELARQAGESAKRAEEAERARATRFQVAALIASVIGILAVIATVVAGIQATNVGAQLATAEFRATVSGLQSANERAWMEAFQEIPTYAVTPMPADIIATATTWALPLPPEPIATVIGDVEMVQVPAGCFLMGSGGNFEGERSVHEICFGAPFWIDRYEVTNDQFRRLNGQAEYPPDWPGPNHPRTSVALGEAQAFCEDMRGARLPTEAEWEYAARGPHSRVYPWGNEFVAGNVVYDSIAPEEVGSRREGMSWVGAYDMSGNVWEWVSTIYHAYPYPTPGSDVETDEWLSNGDISSFHVLRGGSFLSIGDGLRTAFRLTGLPVSAVLDYGFRCARSD
jgi:formylglycine-generating enzyme required for sulfatase activity